MSEDIERLKRIRHAYISQVRTIRKVADFEGRDLTEDEVNEMDRLFHGLISVEDELSEKRQKEQGIVNLAIYLNS